MNRDLGFISVASGTFLGIVALLVAVFADKHDRRKRRRKRRR